jgi:hypothetical protein
MNIAELLSLITSAQRDEKKIRDLKHRLKGTSAQLVPNCPHNEAVDHTFAGRGSGTHRICTTCGLNDMASYGGTSGDEYDYGYPGYPNPRFWADTKVTVETDEKAFYKLRNQWDHNWVVKDGEAVDRWA